MTYHRCFCGSTRVTPFFIIAVRRLVSTFCKSSVYLVLCRRIIGGKGMFHFDDEHHMLYCILTLRFVLFHLQRNIFASNVLAPLAIPALRFCVCCVCCACCARYALSACFARCATLGCVLADRWRGLCHTALRIRRVPGQIQVQNV